LSPSALRAACLPLTLAAFLAATGCSAGPNGWESSDAVLDDDMDDDTFAEDEELEPAAPHTVAKICVRKKTTVRTAYQPCNDAEKGYAWYYLELDAKIPAVGKKPKFGSFESLGDDWVHVSDKGGIGDEIALSDEADRIEICVRTSTRVRTGDGHCDDGDDGHEWYYIPVFRHVPRVGASAERGTYDPSEWWTLYRASTKGGKGSTAAIKEPSPQRPTAQPTQICRTPDMRRPSIRYCYWVG
jgi:hypothetical protein